MDFYEYSNQGDKILNALRTCGKQVILYGTGSIGNYIGQLLKEVVSCYCVTQNDTGASTFNGLPLYAIDELPFEAQSCKVILTLDSRHWKTVTDKLTAVGFTDIEPASIDFQNALLSRYYQGLFEQHQVKLDGELIEIKGTKIRNPLMLSDVDFKAILIEMNDLVLGDILKDTTLWSEGPYLHNQVQLEPGDVVIDCGANLGLFSCIAAAQNCTSYAFEPTPRLWKDLDICSKAYSGAIIPCNYALSNQSGTAELAMSSEWDVANTIMNDSANTIIQEEGYDNFSQVQTITIDEFVKQNQLTSVDFIKADIEGAERLMLEGAAHTLATFAPKLSICTYHYKDDPEVLEAIVRRANPNYIIEHKWKKMYAYVLR